MPILIRLLALILILLVVLWLLRPLLAKVLRNPRARWLLSGVGMNLLRLFLLRRAFPYLLRALRMLRFFR